MQTPQSPRLISNERFSEPAAVGAASFASIFRRSRRQTFSRCSPTLEMTFSAFSYGRTAIASSRSGRLSSAFIVLMYRYQYS